MKSSPAPEARRPAHFLSVLEDDKGGKTAHPEALDKLWGFVPVDDNHLERTCRAFRNFLHNRRRHTAGPAPRGAHVHKDGRLRAQHFGVEIEAVYGKRASFEIVCWLGHVN